MSISTPRIFYHVVGRPFLRTLVLPLFGVLLTLFLADATTNWNALRDQLASLSALARAVIFSVYWTVGSPAMAAGDLVTAGHSPV